MTIEVELSPEIEASLAAQAALQRMELSTYAASLLERAALPQHRRESESAAQTHAPADAGRKSLPQLFADSPFRGLDIDFKRDADLGREIAL